MNERQKTAMRYAVLLSGSGRTLANLLAATHENRLEGEIVAVVSSRPDVRGLEIARDADIPAVAIDRAGFPSALAFSDAIYAFLEPFRPHLILLAGFLRKIVVRPDWENRILNIHPALLPEMAASSGRGFYGDRVHAAVLAAGMHRSGATVHVVDSGYDTGRVLRTREVPVLPGDTVESLAARVFEAECVLYPEAVSQYVEANRDWLIRGNDRERERVPEHEPLDNT